MNKPDLINGLFEFSGAIAGAWNVRTLVRDKAIKGFSLLAQSYFISWSLWNLFYYPHLRQWCSLTGGICLTLTNGTFMLLAVYYSRRK